jgi:predicted DNA-binding transcriptional regulator AlpA
MEVDEMEEQSKDRPGASIPDLASEYGVSEALLYGLANRGDLPGCRRLGKRFVIHRATFEEWLKTGTGDNLENE